MKKMNNKGFTIVELVIVIAVIAILAAVMIPTFSGIVTKANESAAAQVATAAFKEAYATELADGVITNGDSEEIGDFTVTFTTVVNGQVTAASITAKTGTKYAGYTFTFANGAITAQSPTA